MTTTAITSSSTAAAAWLAVLTLVPTRAVEEAAAEESAFEPSIWGLELRVPSVADGVRFYREGLGFELVEEAGTAAARLDLEGFRLILKEAPPQGQAAAAEGAAAIALNFWARDLLAAAESVAAAGGEIGEVQPFLLGRCIAATDPFGNAFDLLEVAGFEGSAGELAVFNVGLGVRSFEEEEPFLTGLGFRVYSRDYLPDALPYHDAGASSLVLHAGASSPCVPGTRQAALLLDVPRLDPALEELRAREICRETPRIFPTAFGRSATVRSPSGLAFQLLERSPQQLAFERLRAQAGKWEGQSTMGWTGTAEVEVIARGTVVVQRSTFEAHPGETMMTAYHMDGGELLLTHYCVAGNQPRLRATRFDDDGSALTFTWLDGTNLRSRDDGHMDEVLYRFAGPDAFTSTWQWFQDGKQRPMEEIRYARVASAAR